MDPITLQVISPTSNYPLSFSLNCSSTSYPPTVVSWLLNGAEQLPVSSSSSQLVRDTLTTTYDNILSIIDFNMTGRLTFTCIVNNTRGSQSAEVVIRGKILFVNNYDSLLCIHIYLVLMQLKVDYRTICSNTGLIVMSVTYTFLISRYANINVTA